jgi:hypothetical protein
MNTPADAPLSDEQIAECVSRSTAWLDRSRRDLPNAAPWHRERLESSIRFYQSAVAIGRELQQRRAQERSAHQRQDRVEQP